MLSFFSFKIEKLKTRAKKWIFAVYVGDPNKMAAKRPSIGINTRAVPPVHRNQYLDCMDYTKESIVLLYGFDIGINSMSSPTPSGRRGGAGPRKFAGD